MANAVNGDPSALEVKTVCCVFLVDGQHADGTICIQSHHMQVSDGLQHVLREEAIGCCQVAFIK